MTDPTTLAEARDNLHTVLQDAANTVGAAVFDHVPTPGNAPSPCVIVDLNGVQFDAAEFVFPVRIYQKASTPGVEQAQRDFVGVVDEVDDLVGDESWQLSGTCAYVEQSDCWVGDFRVTLPRRYV